MTVTFPRSDILTGVEYSDQKFQLMSRQDLSRSALGRTYGKDLGSALWVAEYTTVPMYHDDAIDLEAKLNSLDGVINEFTAGDLRRIMPKAYPTGNWPGGGALAATILSLDSGTNKHMQIGTLPVGFIVSRGDYVHFNYDTPNTTNVRALHQAMETVAANGAGQTPNFEIRPHLRQFSAPDPGTPVTLVRAEARFVLQPGSADTRIQDGLFSVVSFKAVQSI